MFYAGLALSICGLFFSTYRTFKGKNYLSPQMILFACILLFLYLPPLTSKFDGVNDYEYNFVLFMGVVGALVASFVFPCNVLDQESNQRKIITPNKNLFKFCAYLYVLFLFYEVLVTIIKHGSISAVFSANRLSSGLGEELLNGSAFRLLIIEVLKVFFYFYVAILFENGKRINAFILFLVPMLHHLFTALTRFDFVIMAGAFTIYYLNYRLKKRKSPNKIGFNVKKPIRLVKTLLLVIIGSYLVLFFMQLANLIRHGINAGSSTIDLSFKGLFSNSLETDSRYYEYFYNEYLNFANGRAEYERGLSWWYYPIVNFIPRSLWANKPYTSFSVRATEMFYWSYTSGNPVVTFSIFGEGYGQFGTFGCFVSPFVFLFCRWINFRQLKKIRYGQLYALVIMLSMFTYMRAEAPIFYVIIDGACLFVIRKLTICSSVPRGVETAQTDILNT